MWSSTNREAAPDWERVDEDALQLLVPVPASADTRYGEDGRRTLSTMCFCRFVVSPSQSHGIRTVRVVSALRGTRQGGRTGGPSSMPSSSLRLALGSWEVWPATGKR
jgi:hypothetical protein